MSTETAKYYNVLTNQFAICGYIVVDFIDLPNLSAPSSMFSNLVKTELHSEQSLSSIENIFLCAK
jgi:hypothetical protein